MCKPVNGWKVTKFRHDQISPVYHAEFAVRGISLDFVKRAWGSHLEKCDDFTECLILEEQDRVKGF